MKFIKRINRGLFGYDFFISYSRQDCSEYASQLANILIEKGYSCYLDQWGSNPGKILPSNLQKIIKNSSVFIVLGSDESIFSEAINKELDLFLATKRVIIPVDFGRIFEAKWFSKIEGIALYREKNLNSPSNQLITRLNNAFKYTKQSKRIKSSAFSAIALIIISVLVSFYITTTLKNEIAYGKEELNNNQKNLDSVKSSFQKVNKSLIISSDSLEKQKEHLIKVNEELENAKLSVIKFETQAGNYYSVASKINNLAMNTITEIQNERSQLLDFIEFEGSKIQQEDGSFINQLIDIPFVFFDFDKYNIRYDAAQELNKIVLLLQKNKNLSVNIISTTHKFWWNNNALEFFDDPARDNALINPSVKAKFKYETVEGIDRRRAKSIENYFKSKGISENRIILGHEYIYIKREDYGLQFETELKNRSRMVKFKLLKK